MTGPHRDDRELLAWLDDRLAAAGRRRTGDVTVPRVRPWGTVMRAETDRGPVWLKLPAPDTAFEVALYPLLHRLAPDHVLAPLAADPARGWLLLPDGGETLRDRPPEEFEQVLPRYAELQRALAPAADELIALGVTDMRPSVLPRRLDEALALVDGVAEVRARRAWFAEIAAGLAGSRVPASLDHADLHPGNVFAADGRCYDWGDSVVGHPFGSMLVALRGAGDRAREAYLEVFTDLAPRAELRQDLRRARIAGNVIRALTWHRALSADPGHGHGTAHAEGPARHLRQLLSASAWQCP
ncbi:aminoglycoside phosphotransferase family protein [Dactylosporangium sp. CA-139114]|uniref:aminoglycoside phosphotransferase family protein n=1 Tax=Dactylosporangium sp. CA-139114 TaxID=3239931 RepID=UPI003D99B892